MALRCGGLPGDPVAVGPRVGPVVEERRAGKPLHDAVEVVTRPPNQLQLVGEADVSALDPAVRGPAVVHPGAVNRTERVRDANGSVVRPAVEYVGHPLRLGPTADRLEDDIGEAPRLALPAREQPQVVSG